jgi:hypothetical protein
LSATQFEILMFGEPIIHRDGAGFDSPEHAKCAWAAHRAGLMVEPHFTGAGRRPAAFFQFDLAVTPPTKWWGSVKILEEHSLLSLDEMAAIERQHPMLSATQPATCCQAFETTEGIRASLGSGGGSRGRSLQPLARELEFAAGWHARRGRTTLAEKYARLAENVRNFLEVVD